jgi:hypothetical protein
LKKKRPLDEESTAFHEAGHAVVGYRLGFRFDVISILDSEEVHGVTFWRLQNQHTIQGVVDFDITQRPPDNNVSLLDRLTYLFAGIAAQRLLGEKRGVRFDTPPLSHDMHEAEYYVRNFSTEVQNELFSSAENRAIKFLSDPQVWQVLERIAAKLLEVKTLDGLSLYEMLENIPKT